MELGVVNEGGITSARYDEICQESEPLGKVSLLATFTHYRVGNGGKGKGRPRSKQLCRRDQIVNPGSRGGKTVCLLRFMADGVVDPTPNPVGMGNAVCSMSDTFCRSTGRGQALFWAILSLPGYLRHAAMVKPLIERYADDLKRGICALTWKKRGEA